MENAQQVPFLVNFFFIYFPIVALGSMSLRYFLLVKKMDENVATPVLNKEASVDRH